MKQLNTFIPLTHSAYHSIAITKKTKHASTAETVPSLNVCTHSKDTAAVKPSLKQLGLVLAFLYLGMLVFSCAPSASSGSATPPTPLSELVDRISTTATNENSPTETLVIDVTGIPGTETTPPTIVISGLTNALDGNANRPSWNIPITSTPDDLATTPAMMLTIPDPATFSPTNMSIPDGITVTNLDATTTLYALEVQFRGALIKDWLTPDAAGAAFFSATLGSQTATITLTSSDQDTTNIQITDLLNSPDEDGGGMLVVNRIPPGYMATSVTFPNPPGIDAAPDIATTPNTLTISETNLASGDVQTDNQIIYTIDPISFTAVTAFTPSIHIKVTIADTAKTPVAVTFDVVTPQPPGSPTINIIGLRNSIDDTHPGYTITIDPIEGLFNTPDTDSDGMSDPIIISVSDPTGFDPVTILVEMGTTITNIQPDPDEIVHYLMHVVFGRPLVTDLYTSGTANFVGEFDMQDATTALSVDPTSQENLITFSDLTNVNIPDLNIAISAPPAGYMLNTAELRGLTAAEINNLDAATLDIGTITVTEVDAMNNPLSDNTASYNVRLELQAYVPVLDVADIGSIFIKLDKVTKSGVAAIDGATITLSGFENFPEVIPGDFGTFAISIRDQVLPAAYIATDIANMNDPPGSEAATIPAGTVIIASPPPPQPPIPTPPQVRVVYAISVEFSSSLSLELRFSAPSLGPSPITISSGELLTVSSACTLFHDPQIVVIDGATARMDYTVSNTLPSYYVISADDIIAPATHYALPPSSLEIKDDSGTSLGNFDVTINFLKCTAANITGDGLAAATAYEIDSAPKLALFSELIYVSSRDGPYDNKYFKVTADIDLGTSNAPWSEAANTPWSTPGGNGFRPIGSGSSSWGLKEFDCGNHIISNLYINANSVDTGLFSASTNDDGTTTIKNCGLENVKITNNNSNTYDTGGFIGVAAGNMTTIANSYVTGSISGGIGVGGLIGISSNGGTHISNSYAEVTVSGADSVGGLIGYHTLGPTVTVTNSYAVGRTTGRLRGGLVGYIESIRAGSSYANSYAVGTNTEGSARGLFGSTLIPIPNGAINYGSLYWDITATGQDSFGAGLTGQYGRSTTAMQASMPVAITRDGAGDISNPDAHIYSGWDIAVWNFTTGMYPRLINIPCPNRQHLSLEARATTTCAQPPLAP